MRAQPHCWEANATNTDEFDLFGRSLALSDDGSTLAVGAPGEASNAEGVDANQKNNKKDGAGAVYVFTRGDMGEWAQQAYVKASNTDELDHFGGALALSEDGSVLAVGAESEDSNATGIDGDQDDDSITDAGAVYLFERDEMDVWEQENYIKASNTGEDFFGHSVALSDDGKILAVGALTEASGATGIDGDQSDDSVEDAGAVYVFTQDQLGSWAQTAYVKASNTDGNDWFGVSVALSDDGTTLVVTAYKEDSGALGIDGDQMDESTSSAGALYVYQRDEASLWAQTAYVKASNAGASDMFGSSVALSDDGSTLAVGARGETSSATGIGGDQLDDSTMDAGAVYLY